MQKTGLSYPSQPFISTEPLFYKAGRQCDMHSFHTQLADSLAVQIRDAEIINNQ